MLVYFNDAVTQQQIAINPTYVTAVYVVPEGNLKGKTVIGLTNGNVIVDESQITVVGVIQGQL